ncbi:MBOAT family protein [soil metagenome]
MLFNSLHFIVFFIIVLVGYFLTPSKWRWFLLLAASCYFYMAFIPIYILILVAIIVIDYFAAIAIEKTASDKKRKIIYHLALLSNLLIIIFFKYYNFLNENISSLLTTVKITNPIPFLNIILPLGLSFHTFQALGYLIDVKNGKAPAEKHFGHYALFVMFFPQLVAGPIERANQLLPQFNKSYKLNSRDFTIGFSQMMLGFFKKVVVGDMLGNYVDTFYHSYEHHSGFATLFTCWIFVFQLYADFSGYSDIAIGSARMMGYKLNINFALPLFSKTMTEFWRRWHISLSTWLRDYLFTPIAVAKRDWGKYAIVFAQMATFAIAGFWHGAGWNFFLYGIVLGVYLVTEMLLKIKSSYYNKNFFRKCLGVFITFNLFSLSLVFFRSPSFRKSMDVFKSIFTDFFPLNIRIYDGGFFVSMMAMLLILLGIDYIFFRNNSFDSLYHKRRGTIYALNISLFVLILLFGISSNTQFIYFQF